MRRVRIWDTTLRDGLQVPGVAVTLDDKIEMAMNIRDLGVEYMEVGYPAVSPQAYEETAAIAAAIGRDSDSPWIAAYAQANREELKKAYECIREVRYPMLHLVIGASRQQMENRRNGVAVFFDDSPNALFQHPGHVFIEAAAGNMAAGLHPDSRLPKGL